MTCGNKTNAKKDELYNFLWEFTSKRDPRELKSCLPPCLTMSIQMKRTYYLTNAINNAHIDIKVDEDVAVLTDVYSYDIFNLVVELGSALGLWLGFSALSLFDLSVMYLSFAKRKFGH